MVMSDYEEVFDNMYDAALEIDQQIRDMLLVYEIIRTLRSAYLYAGGGVGYEIREQDKAYMELARNFVIAKVNQIFAIQGLYKNHHWFYSMRNVDAVITGFQIVHDNRRQSREPLTKRLMGGIWISVGRDRIYVHIPGYRDMTNTFTMTETRRRGVRYPRYRVSGSFESVRSEFLSELSRELERAVDGEIAG